MTARSSILHWVVGTASVFLCIPLALMIAGFLFPWSQINCWDEEIDLHSGRIRTTWYLCFVPASERIEESAFSRALSHEDVQVTASDWRKVNTFSPGIHYSPHYTFHGAITEMSMIEDAWQVGEFTPDARLISAERILELWQSRGLWNSRDYCHAIAEIGFRNFETNRETTVDDLPP